MQFKSVFYFSLFLILGSCSAITATHKVNIPKNVTLIDEIKPKEDFILIPYSKYILDNGLTIILHQDNSEPLVYLSVTYHVGSARETQGKTGLAHLFEHMLFQGSENVKPNEHFKIVKDSGGTVNGYTTKDLTRYHQTVPSNQLEKIIWLEADRMGYLIESINQKKFEIQQKTVINERKQTVDNKPYGLKNEKIDQTLYPKDHPYSTPIIGYENDIKNTTFNDLKLFYKQWYAPNNAIITISGNFDIEQSLGWINKYFSDIPRGAAMPKLSPSNILLEETHNLVLEDNNISNSLVSLTFPTVHSYHEDEAALDFLSIIIGEGVSSILYKNLVKTKLASKVSSSHYCEQLACEFSIEAYTSNNSNRSIRELEMGLRDAFTEFEKFGIDQKNLKRIKGKLIADRIYSLQSTKQKASYLSHYELLKGSPNYIVQDITRYQAVSDADIMKVYNKYIKNKHSVVLNIVAQGQADEINSTVKKRTKKIASLDIQNSNFINPISSFDRSIHPPSEDNLNIETPSIWNDKLVNSIQVIGNSSFKLPITLIQLKIKNGQYRNPDGKSGLSYLTAEMLNKSSKSLSTEQINQQLQILGSTITIESDDFYTIFLIKSLSKNLDTTLKLLAQKLFNPLFSEQDFQQVKFETINKIKADSKDPFNIANQAQKYLLFGKENSFAFDRKGSIGSVEKLTLNDIKNYYKNSYSSSIASLAVISNLPKNKIVPKLKIFNQLQTKPIEDIYLRALPENINNKIYLVDWPGASQTEIRVSKPIMKYDALGDFYRFSLMDYPLGGHLGGHFNSRVNLNLREDKGYTYGAYSYIYGNDYTGFFEILSSVRTDVTTEALIEIDKELDNYHQFGISDSELITMKKSIPLKEALAYETIEQKINYLSRIQEYNLPKDFIKQKLSILLDITKHDIDFLSDKYLEPKQFTTILVGDKQKILPKLKTLRKNIIEIDQNFNILGQQTE